jgi:hypothetical protein
MTNQLRLVLIGCSKTKKPYKPDPRRGGRITAEEMYAGQLFKKRVEYAKRLGLEWFVLSAEYGLWRPEAGRKPYDATMRAKSPAERAIWHAHVAYCIVNELWEPLERGECDRELHPAELTVEIHAGRLYAHPLDDILRSLGVTVKLPCAGMGIGEQLKMYTTGSLSGKVEEEEAVKQ